MRFLSNKEKKELKEILPPGYELGKKDEVKEDNDMLFVNGEKALIISGKNKKKILKFIPHLRTLKDEFYKAVYVDHGAIPFLMKGADMMRPGIQIIDDGFEKDEIILVKDEEHKKTLAVAKALFNSEDMKNQEKGKSVEVIHYMGDELF